MLLKKLWWILLAFFACAKVAAADFWTCPGHNNLGVLVPKFREDVFEVGGWV